MLVTRFFGRARQLDRNAPLTTVKLTFVIKVHTRKRAHEDGNSRQAILERDLASRLIMVFEKTDRAPLVLLVRRQMQSKLMDRAVAQAGQQLLVWVSCAYWSASPEAAYQVTIDKL